MIRRVAFGSISKACNAATAAAGAVFRPSGSSSSVDIESPISRICSVTMNRCSSLPTTIGGANSDLSDTRLAVCWKSVSSPWIGRNCFGNDSRDSGHSRVPVPPHIRTGMIKGVRPAALPCSTGFDPCRLHNAAGDSCSDATARQEFPAECCPEDSKVERERPMLDVFEILVDPRFCDRGVQCASAQAVYLRKARDTGAHDMALEVVGHEFLVQDATGEHARNVRPRPDQRHIPSEDIPQLWKLIQAGLPQPSPNRCYARIASLRLPHAAWIGRIDEHRPELQDLKVA